MKQDLIWGSKVQGIDELSDIIFERDFDGI